MKELFKQILMDVVQNKQKEASAYMDAEQIKLMFEVGRSVGFKTIASAMVGHSVVLLNQHDPFDDIFVKVVITETCANLCEVRVTREYDPDYAEFLHKHEEEFLDWLLELEEGYYEEYKVLNLEPEYSK